MNKLSNKTSAILKENYLSVVYAREMSEGIKNINRDITSSFLTGRHADSVRISKELKLISTSLHAEKNNITEAGEEKLVANIDADYSEYIDSVSAIIKAPISAADLVYLQNKSDVLSNQFLLLSQMNGSAIEAKTDDAKASAKRALTQMTILATVCFLIGLSFTFSFASYFSQRFFQLYKGIKEIVSSNFDQRLFFEGKDEFYEISLVFNEMAEKLKKNKQKTSVTLYEEIGKDASSNDIEELKTILLRVKSLEEQAAALISRFEKK